MVAAIAISGKLDFNPITDYLINKKGKQVKLAEPQGNELPPNGFAVEDNGYQEPAQDGSNVEIIIKPESDRLQLLKPFNPWNGENIIGAKLLIKAKGKCTTDHISMAGPWLKYRGHLDNISNNCLIGAVNAFGEKTNAILNQLSGKIDTVPNTARAYKKANIISVVVGDHNYGEGSSREHAAMEPRHLGVIAVIVKSFARIHETNLKKQGILALTFANEKDYEIIREKDTFNFGDLSKFSEGKQLNLEIIHNDGTKNNILLNHTYNKTQIEWFRAGSALNLIKQENA